MSGRTYAAETPFCNLQTEANERRPQYATEVVPVSIDRRWCAFHEKWEMFGYLQRTSQKGWWSRKAREVLALFIVGEIIAIATLLIAGGAVAAMR
jgi:hypothetical protein